MAIHEEERVKKKSTRSEEVKWYTVYGEVWPGDMGEDGMYVNVSSPTQEAVEGEEGEWKTEAVLYSGSNMIRFT